MNDKNNTTKDTTPKDIKNMLLGTGITVPEKKKDEYEFILTGNKQTDKQFEVGKIGKIENRQIYKLIQKIYLNYRMKQWLPNINNDVIKVSNYFADGVTRKKLFPIILRYYKKLKLGINNPKTKLKTINFIDMVIKKACGSGRKRFTRRQNIMLSIIPSISEQCGISQSEAKAILESIITDMVNNKALNFIDEKEPEIRIKSVIIKLSARYFCHHA